MDNDEKISRSSFDELFEIIFGEEQTINSGTSLPFFNQKQAFLKNKHTKEIIPTGIFADDKDFGEAMVIGKFCKTD